MLNKMFKLLSENKIINETICEECNIDDMLDLRDIPEFDREWMRVYNQIKLFSIDSKYKEIIMNIRKEAFIKAYNVSKSSDFASCVSDDFELIIKARIINYSDEWLNSVIYSYALGEFPCGEVKNVLYELDEVWRRIIEKE